MLKPETRAKLRADNSSDSKRLRRAVMHKMEVLNCQRDITDHQEMYDCIKQEKTSDPRSVFFQDEVW